MISKIYLFASLRIELRSKHEITPSEQFSGFYGEGAPDLSFEVICASLPEKKGEPVFESQKRSCYRHGETEYFYTSFYDGKSDSFLDYACRVCGAGGNYLYIDYDKMWESMVFEALNVADILIRRKIAVLHSSFVVCGDSAVLFSGDKQAGKSTQASLWERYAGALVVNGDRAAIQETSSGAYAFGIPFRGSSKISLHVNKPVRAIILLAKGRENRLTRLKAAEAFRNILGKLTYDVWNEESVEAACEMAEYAAENIEIYRYECLPDKSAVDFLRGELERAASPRDKSSENASFSE